MLSARELSSNERAILAKILSASCFSGAQELESQVDAASVVGGIPTFLDLRVSSRSTPAPAPDGPVPAQGFVRDSQGRDAGLILIWVEDGFLSGLEFAWVTDETPSEFPSPDAVQVGGAQ